MLNRQMKNRGSRLSRSQRRSGKRGSAGRLITAGVLAGLTSVPALAGPKGEQVVHGSAAFNRSGANTTITTSHRAIINYQSFNLNSSESVRFLQPHLSSSVLNRIKNGMPTSMDGSVFANGNVYFVNPAGIYFGQSAVLNVGGIFAAAGNISNQDFLNNVNRFTDLSGEVINRGQIFATSGAHLVGRRVANFGSIVAPEGMVSMTAGDDVLIGERGGKVFARLTGDASNPGSVENHGVVKADQVLAGVGDHFAMALYDSSVIRGSSVQIVGGENSTVRVRGEIDASNAAGRGGEIDVLGGKIAIQNATLDASGSTGGGQIHVGGDYQGKGERLTSRLTYVDQNSQLNVGATRSGDAGTAIVWSDNATYFYGDISASGANKGGFAEVSGKGYLDFRGTFNLRGAAENGTLLLDPKNISIVANGTGPAMTEADFDQFSDNASGTSLLDADLLSGWLDGNGGNIILQASNDIFFLNNAIVTQGGGFDNDLSLFAGRRIIFFGGSELNLTGGSLFATANAQGFEIGERDPGFGTIMALNGSIIRSDTGSLNFTVDSVSNATSTPGDLVLFGDVRAPVLTLDAQFTNSRIGLVEDGDAGNGHIGEGGRVEIDAGQFVVFLDHAGEWSFEHLDVASPLIVFDEDATGVAATGAALGDGLFFEQLVRPGAVGMFTQNAAGFTFTGQTISLDAELTASGGATFAGAADLFRDMSADGDIVFQQDVTLNGPVALTLDASGDLIDFQAGVLAGVAAPDLTLNLNSGRATFTGDVGAVANPLGDIVVNGLDTNDAGLTLDFQSDIFAGSLTSVSGFGSIILGGNVDLRGTSADAVNSLNLLASNNTIEIHGNIDSFAGINFGSNAELHGGGTNTITLFNGGLLTFGGTLNADAGENLTLDLGGGGALFVDVVGGTGSLGAIGVNGLGTTLTFQEALTADSLTIGNNAGDDAGTVLLLDGATLTGDLNVFADTININNAAVTANAIDLTWSTLFNGDADVLRAATVGLTADGVAFVADTEAEAVDESIVTDLTMRAINGAALTLSGTAAAQAIDQINNVTLSSAGVLRFEGHAGDWNFVNLAARGAGVEFDTATGLTVLGQVGASQILDATTGDITITGVGAGEFDFNIFPPFVLTDDISSDGDLRFSTAVDLQGAGSRVIGFTNAGDLLTFANTLDSTTGTGFTLNLNGGGATFADTVGAGNPLGAIDVNGLGTALDFQNSLTAASLTVGDTIGDDAGTVTLGGVTLLNGAGGLTINSGFTSVNAATTTTSGGMLFNSPLFLGADLSSFAGITVNGDTGLVGGDRVVTLTGAGNVLFNGLVNSEPGARGLTLALGGFGDATFTGVVGSVAVFELGAITVTGLAAGEAVHFQQALNAGSLSVGVLGDTTGTVTLDGATSLTGAGGLAINAATTNLNNNVTTSAGGMLFNSLLNLGGDLDSAADIDVNGALALLGNGVRTITLAGGQLTVTGDTTAPGGSGLTLALGTGGAQFQGLVGTGGAPLGDIIVNGLGTTLDFQQDLFADSIFADSGAGDIIFGGDITLLGTDAGGVNSLDLLASNATIDIHGNLISFANAIFRSAAELHGGGLHTFTMQNGSTLTFGDTLNAVAGDSLTLELGGGASAFFSGAVGNTGRLGDILANNLTGTLNFGSTLTGTSLVSTSGTGAVVLTGATDLDPNPGADNPLTEHLTISAADITIGDTVTTDLIDLTYTNSLSLGVLNAETVRITAIGADLEFRMPDNIGLDLNDLRLETQAGGNIVLIGTLADIDLTGPAAGNVRNVADARFISDSSIFFTGANAGDGANWLFQDLLATANEGIIFSVTAPQRIEWVNALAGVHAFNADADDSNGFNDLISIASSDFTFGGVGGLFALRDDIRANGDLTFARDVRLDNGARRIDLLNAGNTITFQNLLTANADNNLNLGLNAGGADFMAQVGDNAGGRLGDIVAENLGTTLDFQADLFADSLTSVSAAGDVILGGDVDLDGVNTGGINSLELDAAPTTIEIHGNITSFANALFNSAAELHGGGLHTITMLNGSTLTFNSTLIANGLGDSLTLDLAGNASALFNGDVGNNAAGRLGDVRVNDLGALLRFSGDLFASTLFVNNDGGPVSVAVLGDTFGGDVFDLSGAIGDNALDVDTTLTVVGSDILATAGGMLFNGHVGLAGGLMTTDLDGNIIINDGVDVRGDRTISVVDGRIDIFQGAAPVAIPVLLNTSLADSALRLVSNNGLIRIESTANGSVVRSAGGAFNSTLEADSVGGIIDLGSVGGDGNALTLLDLDTTTGANVFRGGRYFANTVMLNAGGGHTVSTGPATVVFGDDNGVTSVVDLVSITGGNLVADPGQTVELNALNAGGDVILDGARTNGAGTFLNLNADDHASFGANDSLGAAGFRFAEVNVNSTDVTVGANGAVFADSLFFNPRTGTLNYGFGPALGDMDVDAGEVAVLNLGGVGTLFLGHNDPATAGAFAGTTNLFGVSSIGDFIRVFGTTNVDGVFDARDGQMHLYGPTTLMNNAGLSTSTLNQGMFFYDSLNVMAANTLTTNGGPISFINLDPDGPGGPTGLAAINGVGVGPFDLTINTNGGRATLFNVGDTTALTTFNVTANQIFFNGSTYNAGAQAFTSDEYRLLGDFSGVLPGQANFNGDTLLFNDAGGLGNAEIRLGNGINLTVNMTDTFTSNAALLGNPIGGASDQAVVINAANQILFTDSIGWDGIGDPALADPTRAVGSVVFSSDQITLASVLTSGDQSYADPNALLGLNTINLSGDRYQSLTGSTITFGSGLLLLNPPSGTTSILTADGGTVNFNGATVNGNDNSLVVNTGATGVINYAAGIDINNAAQDYTAGNYNFLGSATLSSDQPLAAIAFQGGTLDMQGMFTAQTVGAGASISLGNQVNLNGFDLDAFADGANSNVTLPVLISNGGETVRVRANGDATLGGIQNVGVAVLDLRSNQLAILGGTLADQVLIQAFDPARDISVGQNVGGTLNVDNTELAFLQPVAGGQNTLQIGETGYAGRVFINTATINRDTMFIADGAGGFIRVSGGGLLGTGGLTDLDFTSGDIQLGGQIQSNAGAYTLDLNGPVNVFSVADIDSNGGAVTFTNAINGFADGSGFLDVETGGGLLTLPETFGVIGGDRALAQVSFSGSPILRLVGVNTTGDQFFGSPAITLLDGAAFTAQNRGQITFTGPAQALGGFTAQVNGTSVINSIAFLGDITGAGNPADNAAIDAGVNGAVQLAAVNGFGAINVLGGTLTLNGDLNAINDLLLQGNQAFITGDRMLTAGNSITLTTDLDSQGGAAALSLEDAITTLINGRLGGNSPLASFNSSDQGTTTLTGGVFSDGRATFRNNVLVAGDATVQSFGDTRADGIRFLGTIDGATPGTGSLTLITDRTKGQLLLIDPLLGTVAPDPDVALIELFGGVGLTNALDTLAFNFGPDVNGAAVDGRAFSPADATIVLGDSDAFLANGTLTDFTLNADNLLMGAREKLDVLGSLEAIGSFARLSDMATVGDMLVAFDQVTILLREQGFVFDPTTQLAVLDEATDFVSGGAMDFGTITALQPLGLLVSNPEFSLPGGDPTVNSTAGFFLVKSLEETVTNLIVDQNVLLDPRADGPSNTNVAEAIAGATPRQEQADPAVAEPTLSQAALDALTRLQISIKTPDQPGYLLDLPEVAVNTGGTARVSRRRLEPQLVANLVDTFRSSFVVSRVDAAGVPVEQDRRGEIQTILADAVTAYESSNEDVTAEGLMAFLRQNPEDQAPALTEIGRLRQIVTEAQQLGLTDQEMVTVKGALVRDTKPNNLVISVYRDLIEPDQTLLLGVR